MFAGAGGGRYHAFVIGDAYQGNAVRGHGCVPVKALTNACVSVSGGFILLFYVMVFFHDLSCTTVAFSMRKDT